MKAGKFASVTSALLARKGEARPWTNGGVDNGPARETAIGFFPQTALFGQGMKDQANDASPFPSIGIQQAENKIRKLALRISQADYERLGLIAVKRDTTRQRLVQQIMSRFLGEATQEFGAGCACIGGAQEPQD